MDIDTPTTPLHPNADSEVDLKGLAQQAPADFDLDLNPEISDADEDIEFEDVEPIEPLKNKTLEQVKKESGIAKSRSVTSLKELDELSEFATTEELDDGGFADVEQPRNSPINPFKSDTGGSTSARFAAENYGSTDAVSKRRLSLAQQSRFVQFIDDRLLQIQRKFIKHLSTADDLAPDDVDSSAITDTPSGEADTKYTMTQLLDELSSVLDFIWYSIFETKTIPKITSGRGSEEVDEPPVAHPSRVFGQTNYLIKIMGDVTEYIQKYDFEEWHDWTELLAFLKKLDSFVSILIDQSEQTGAALVSNTEKIRMDSIISRTKLVAIEKFEHMKFKFSTGENQKRKHEDQDTTGQHDHVLTTYEEKIGEIYEAIIDRISI